MEYYVRECGEVLGVTNKLPADARDAKHILEYILAQVAEFKKLNQVRPQRSMHFSALTTTVSKCLSLVNNDIGYSEKYGWGERLVSPLCPLNYIK